MKFFTSLFLDLVASDTKYWCCLLVVFVVFLAGAAAHTPAPAPEVRGARFQLRARAVTYGHGEFHK